jgi:hypothetical protein
VKALAASLFVLAMLVASSEDEKAEPRVSFAERVANLEKAEGLLTLWLDRDKGAVLLELPARAEEGKPLREFLCVEGLGQGLGSNPVGLDRGRLGQTRLLSVRRLGALVLFEEQNLRYRALTPDSDEQRAARLSFATSVLWAGPVLARSEDGKILVDITSFLVRDGLGVIRSLSSSGQGEYSLDSKRSAVDLGSLLVFPDNVEIDALLTYAGKSPGGQVRSVTPEADSLTLGQHLSLVRLPDARYRPRRFDPRAGSFPVRFLDYAAPLEAPLDTAWIVRHRLLPGEGGAPPEPIVYYVDRGAPEPVRSALQEGASFWSEAFEAAGLKGAFRVELLPAGIHPLDVRYNVIQWVHRSTRGWSYGGGVIDPRTGERIKGHVILGSQRVRQDRLLFEGLLGAEKTGSGEADDPVVLALSRIRQLAAHEVGHTLGFSHNFAASTYGDRASVMDYPAPRIRITEAGDLDPRDAYARGIGVWDRFAVAYAYSNPLAGEDEESFVTRLVDEAAVRGLLFLSDDDARPAGACHPLANLWDNGSDPVAELGHVLQVRAIGLSRFGERCIAEGRPISSLQEVLAPLYFHHRYQVDAAAKCLGGVMYAHRVKGDLGPDAAIVPAQMQHAALDALLGCLEPDVLDLPDPVLALLLPRPPDSAESVELFASATLPTFDALSAAATAADLVLAAILQPERCARLVEQNRRLGTLPGLDLVLLSLVNRVFSWPTDEPERLRPIRREIQAACVERMLRLALHPTTPFRVRAEVEESLRGLRARLDQRTAVDAHERAHHLHLSSRIRRFQERHEMEPGRGPEPLPPPPGSPIGAADMSGCSAGPW